MATTRAAGSAAAAGSEAQTAAPTSGHAAKAAAAPEGSADDPVLPVLDAVSDYEKIKRIGEGTFGIVCEWWWWWRGVRGGVSGA